MSWDRSKYEARCDACGATGFCIKSTDDWGRSSTEWIGFANEAPSATAVSRKRSDARDSAPLCVCGSSAVGFGELLGDCDYTGRLIGGGS
jgi:hypothetical protein